MASPSITTIISDLGNVICPFDYTNFYAKVAAEAKVEPDLIRQICWDPNRYVDFEKGKMSEEEFLGHVQRYFKLRMPLKEMADLFCDIFTVNHDVVALWRDLKTQYQLCMLSNTNVTHITYLKPRQSFWDIFDHLILSYEVGYVKPQPEIFMAAANVCGVKPEACVFVDDIDRYVAAAKGVGMQAIQFQSGPQLKRDLAALGIQ